MEPIETLRQHIAKYTCGKYSLPAIALGRGKNVTVICCCREFANELRVEIGKIPGSELGNLNVHFVAGNVEFV